MSILSSTNSGLEQIPISLEGALKMGWSQVEVDSLEANELENLKALGYCVQVETNFIDVIKW